MIAEREEMKVPVNPEAERASFGGLVADSDTMVPLCRVTMGMVPEDWHDERLSFLVSKIYEMYDARKYVDLMTVCNVAGHLSALVEECVMEAPAGGVGRYYLEIVRQKALARRIIEASRDMAMEARKTEDADALASKAPETFARLMRLPTKQKSNVEVLDVQTKEWNDLAARRAAGEEEVLKGLSSGFVEIDELTAGWQPGLTIIAGRPSAGKSTLEDHLVQHVAMQGTAVARVALDMAADKVLGRTCCRLAGVSMSKLNQGYATATDLAKMGSAAETVGRLPIHMNTTDRDVRSVCSWIRAMKMRHNIGLITVDFIQLLSAQSPGRFMDRNTEMGMISAMLKGVSLDLGVPLIALSQLSRAMEKDGRGKVRKPMLSDLRDSGSLEQDASVVLFLYQDAVNPETEVNTYSKKKNIYIDVMKNQNGEIGRLPAFLYGPYFKIEMADRDHSGEEEE